MYQEFYKLTESPFRLSPDARYFLALGGHRKALAYLRYGLQKREGLIVVTGMPGTGKTTIARLLVAEAARDGVVVSQLNTTSLDADNVIQMVAAAFGLPHDDRTKASLLTQLEAFFTARARAGKHMLLLIDEAQNLPMQSLEELRMLSNFQLGNQSLLQIFLLGQQQFRDILQLPDMEQLRQRVVAACHLDPLTRDETREYIEHRLRLAGWTGDPAFTGDAVDSIFQTTRGIPRNINTFCERVLLFGALEGLHTLNRAAILSVVRELRQEAAENVGAAPLEAELTASQESLSGGISQAKAAQEAAAKSADALASMDLSLDKHVPASASTRDQPAMSMYAATNANILNESQSLMATMTGASGAMGYLNTDATMSAPAADPTPAAPPASAPIPPAGASAPAAAIKDSLVAAENAAAKQARPAPMVAAQHPRDAEATLPLKPAIERPVAASAPVSAAPKAAPAQPTTPPPAAVPPASQTKAPVAAATSAPESAKAKPVSPAKQTVKAATLAEGSAVAAARSAAPMSPPPMVKSAVVSAESDDDDVPVLTMEDQAVARQAASMQATDAVVPPVTAREAAKPVPPAVKRPPESKVSSPSTPQEPARPKPSLGKDKPAMDSDAANDAGTKPAMRPAVAPNIKSPNPASGTTTGRGASLAPMSRPATHVARLPSPLQRLLLVAEQVQANTSPVEAFDLVAGALLEPLPEVLQFALSKDAVSEEWLAALGGRSAQDLRELAKSFLKTVMMAPGSDYYQVLCLSRDASDEQVHANYRALFKLLQSGSGNEVHPAAAARLNHAYHVLRDPARRLAYEISPNAVSEQMAEPVSAVVPEPVLPTISVVEPVTVPEVAGAGAPAVRTVNHNAEDQDHESEQEDDEVEEPHWWRPSPAVLIVAGVAIASVFGVIIWKMGSGNSTHSAQSSSASSANSTPTAFSASENVPSPAPVEAKAPVPATNRDTNGLNGGVAAPVTHADLQSLVKKLVSSYERGNIDNFVTLFDRNVKTGDGSGVAGLRTDYQDLFQSTRRRGMDISNMRWQFSGPSAKGEGDFRVTIIDKSDTERKITGRISLQVAKNGDQVYITGMDYKYSPTTP